MNSRVRALAGLVLCLGMSACTGTSGHPSNSSPSTSSLPSSRTNSSSPTPSSSPPSPAVSGVAAGHSSPSGAVAGFLNASAAGQLAAACAFVTPPEQPVCPDLLAQAPVTVQGAAVRIGNTDINGSQALVVPLGTVCLSGGCLTNTDPNAGLPAAGTSFADAYARGAGSANDPDIDCVLVAGSWYVDLGPGFGSIG